jgi:biotin operon repressor
MKKGNTAVPNILFDVYLRTLKETELKVLLVIIRQTVGWVDVRTQKRKEMDWLSGSQLQLKTGCSRRAISIATESLIQKNLIEVSNSIGTSLSTPEQRQGKLRLFYQLSPKLHLGITSEQRCISSPTSAQFAQDLSRKITALAQNLRITKETLTKPILQNNLLLK